MSAALATAARKVQEWTVARDELICQAAHDGASLRAIAELAGVSHQTVANILARSGDDTLLDVRH